MAIDILTRSNFVFKYDIISSMSSSGSWKNNMSEWSEWQMVHQSVNTLAFAIFKGTRLYLKPVQSTRPIAV